MYSILEKYIPYKYIPQSKIDLVWWVKKASVKRFSIFKICYSLSDLIVN